MNEQVDREDAALREFARMIRWGALLDLVRGNIVGALSGAVLANVCEAAEPNRRRALREERGPVLDITCETLPERVI